MSGGAWDAIKKPDYKVIQEVSRFAEKTGEKWNWDFQKEEGKKNTANPGRAITKAAPYVIGGLLGAAGGGAAAGAGEFAGAATNSAALAGDADMAAIQAGLLSQQGGLTAAQQAAQQGTQASLVSQSLLSPSSWSSSSPGPGVVAPGMQDSANLDTMLIHNGYANAAGQQLPPGVAAPASRAGLLSEAPGPGVVAPGMKYSAQADTALINAGHPELAGGKMTGLLKTGNTPASRYLVSQGLKGLQPQQKPYASPLRNAAQPSQSPMPYGGRSSATPYGGMDLSMLDEETKRKLRAAGVPV